MAVFKCKMCGGDLEILEGATVCECEYCGTKQTVPTAKTEALANLFNRANKLRIKCEFDKAEEIYEKILGKDETLAEAHWGLVLCKYGIEYVEDPATEKRVPTCHRTSYESVTTDGDYLSAVEYADSEQKKIYKLEAKAIEQIQKRTLEIVKSEKPFDVFICYKETDKKGKRTLDSTFANDIYHQLTSEGFKVFYAAITLEDKLGQEYEPYIFAALNSAKVMLVIGSKEEYFNAVWVKNEWSRFLKLMKTDRSKLLIPCYKDIDPYDLPEEFAHLQAQDMGKIGFINDIVRGIKKVVATEEKVTSTTIIQNSNDSVEPLLKRVSLFLNDDDWQSVYDYCEKILDIEPECSDAYLYKFFADFKIHNLEELEKVHEPVLNNQNLKRVLVYCNNELKQKLINISTEVTYNFVEKLISSQKFKDAIEILEVISNYKDSSVKLLFCKEKLEEIKDAHYNRTVIVKDEIRKEIFEEFENNIKSCMKVWWCFPVVSSVVSLIFVILTILSWSYYYVWVLLSCAPFGVVLLSIVIQRLNIFLISKQHDEVLRTLREFNAETKLTEIECANIENIIRQDIVGISLLNINTKNLKNILDILSKYSGFNKKTVKKLGSGFRKPLPIKNFCTEEEINGILKEFETIGVKVEIKVI